MPSTSWSTRKMGVQMTFFPLKLTFNFLYLCRKTGGCENERSEVETARQKRFFTISVAKPSWNVKSVCMLEWSGELLFPYGTFWSLISMRSHSFENKHFKITSFVCWRILPLNRMATTKKTRMPTRTGSTTTSGNRLSEPSMLTIPRVSVT